MTLTAYADETQVLELWGLYSTHLLPSLPGPLRSGAILPVKVPSIDQIDLLANYLY